VDDAVEVAMVAPHLGMRLHHRRSIRVRRWDYAGAGWYFLTCVTWDRRRTLAQVRGGRMCLTTAGRLVDAAWQAIPAHFPGVTLDAFVVMPDHVHGLLRLDDQRHSLPPPGRPWSGEGPPPRSVGAIVGSWKAASTRAIRQACADAPPRIWQRDYYERIIDTGAMLEIIRRYIARNPARWIASHSRPG